MITLLGEGTPVLTASGGTALMQEARVGAAWTDAGVSAWDATDGNVTGKVLSFGVAGVDSSRPTPPGKLFSAVIEYRVRAHKAIKP